MSDKSTITFLGSFEITPSQPTRLFIASRAGYDALVMAHILDVNWTISDNIEEIVIPKPEGGWPNIPAEYEANKERWRLQRLKEYWDADDEWRRMRWVFRLFTPRPRHPDNPGQVK